MMTYEYTLRLIKLIINDFIKECQEELDSVAIAKILDDLQNEFIKETQRYTYLDTPVDIYDISIRCEQCLRSVNIIKISDLVQYTPARLLKIKNLGRKTFKDIKSLLSEMGLELGMKL